MTVAQASDDIGSEKPSTESHEEVSEKATLEAPSFSHLYGNKFMIHVLY